MTTFNQFWQVERSVFLQAVDTNKIFLPQSLQIDLDRLLLLSQQPQTVAFVIGPKGTGKSTYLKWLNAQFPVAQYDTLLTTMISPEPQAGWLARRLSEFFGTRGKPSDNEHLLGDVVSRLDELIEEKRRLVVFVDAAHMAESAEAWQELASLMSLQALAEPCISFVLCGEPRLLQLFTSSESLTTHISFALEVPTLSEAETGAYIHYRLELANITAELPSDALRTLFDESRGVIARINMLAENCLIECSLRESRVITRDIVAAAKRYIAGKPPHVSSATGLGMPLTALYKPSTPPPPVQNVEAPPPPPTTNAADSREKDFPGIRLASLFKSDGSRKR